MKNLLNPKNLSKQVIAWLDKHDPGWQKTQKTPTFHTPGKNIYSNQLVMSQNKNTFTIALNLLQSIPFNVNIFNVQGKTLMSKNYSIVHYGSRSITINKKNFHTGNYFFIISTLNNTIIRPFIIISDFR